MYVFGQLKEASLEIIDGTPAELQAGRIYYDKSRKNVRVIHKDADGIYKLDLIVPIGTILPIINYTNVGNSYHIEINEDMFTWVDGRTINDPQSPFNGMTLPDLTGRYIMGVGNEGGGNMSDTSLDSQVGNIIGISNYYINLDHYHGRGDYYFGLELRTPVGSATIRTAYWSNDYTEYDFTEDAMRLFHFDENDNKKSIYIEDGEVKRVCIFSNCRNPRKYFIKGNSAVNYRTIYVQPRTVKVRYIIRYK